MPSTYANIATTTLSSNTSPITFTSIPSTYTDLKLVITGIVDSTTSLQIRFNSDSATNYSWTSLYGGSGVPGTQRGTSYNGIDTVSSWSTTVPHSLEIEIFSYAGSTFKSVLIKDSNDENGAGGVGIAVGTWRSTSAITSVSLVCAGTNKFAIGTVATLYGILKA